LAEQKEDREGKERIFGIFPAFNVSDQANPVPLTNGQKFKLFARSTYDPVTLVAPLFKVPLLQAVEGDSGFGTGFEGFAKRYGVSLADGTSSRFFRQFLFPTILKEDPRFFRRGQGSFGSRLGYSLSRVFVTKTDSGRNTFNWSRLLGSAASARSVKRLLSGIAAGQDDNVFQLRFELCLRRRGKCGERICTGHLAQTSQEKISGASTDTYSVKLTTPWPPLIFKQAPA
jgi:hypothetical protein